jgi:hypothetical protein
MDSNTWNKLHPNECKAALKRYREKHREEIRQRNRKYGRDFRLNHPGYSQLYVSAWHRKHPQASKAHHIIEDKSELLNTQCEFCDSEANLMAHHPDYDYPDATVGFTMEGIE